MCTEHIVISIGFEPISMPTSADAVIAPTFTDPPLLLSPYPPVSERRVPDW